MNRLSVLASVAVWVLVVSLLAGCSFHVGMDWQGETKIDKRTYSDKKQGN